MSKETIDIETYQCPGCGSSIKLRVNKADYDKWNSGTPIQKAFPYLTEEEGERLISGYCPDCWFKLNPEGFCV